MSGVSPPFAEVVEDDDARAPPSRRDAFSGSSAQIRALERKARNRTDFRLCLRVKTNRAGPSIPAHVRVAHHGPETLIDLSFCARRGLDQDTASGAAEPAAFVRSA